MLTPKQQNVYTFLSKYSVRSGEFRTPLYVLYRYYVYYCRRASNHDFVSPIEFGRRMSQYFEKGKSGRYVYYLTNIKPPKKDKRRLYKAWYNRRWSRMRNGEET